jgi:linoleoyl-CoA desaturase
MEIGHNVMHGQWDWMNDPDIHSSSWDWDTASTPEAWKHSHNYIHHTFTNIRGKDKDLGYEIMRIDPHQPWHPVYLLQPIYNVVLMAFFEWGVAFHDLDLEAIRKGEKSKKQLRHELKGIARKAGRQIAKDYLAYPALTGPKGFKSTLAANFTANIIRNLWAHAIIFCGHFPDQAYSFSQEEVEGETRGGFYVRQLIGAANIEGSPLFHVISGNLGYQVEHHLYPDMPFFKQWGMVQRTILRLAFPGGKPRPKPGPFKRGSRNGSTPDVAERAERGRFASGPDEQRSEGVRVSMPDDG